MTNDCGKHTGCLSFWGMQIIFTVYFGLKYLVYFAGSIEFHDWLLQVC